MQIFIALAKWFSFRYSSQDHTWWCCVTGENLLVLYGEKQLFAPSSVWSGEKGFFTRSDLLLQVLITHSFEIRQSHMNDERVEVVVLTYILNGEK